MEAKLLKVLRDDKVISDDHYQQVLQECEQSSVSFDVALEQLGIMTEDRLLQYLGDKFRLPVVDWESCAIDDELLQLIPEQEARKHTVFPVGFERGKRQGKITLAVANPTNIAAIDDLSFMTGCIVKAQLASAQAIQNAIQTHYGTPEEAAPGKQQQPPQQQRAARKGVAVTGIEQFDAILNKTSDSGELAEEELDTITGLDREHPSTKFLFDILDTAVDRQISEIHIDPTAQEYHVRFGLAGFLYHHTEIPEQVGRGIALRLRRLIQRMELSAGSRKEQTIQTGSFYTTAIRGKLLFVIVKFYLTPFGEKIQVSLKENASLLDIEHVGFDEKRLKTLQRILTKPQGLLLLISAPGQGKTTTLYAILNKFANLNMNITTLEHPIEYFIPGVNQIPFNPQISYQDWFSLISYNAPDVIALEKVESPQMAKIAFEMASNALVLASVSAHDFADGVCLFLSSLLEKYHTPSGDALSLILDSMNGIMTQRLVRTICPHCKHKVPLSEEHTSFLRWLTGSEKDVSQLPIYAGKGCHECMDTGYRGQTGVFEIMKFDGKIKHFLLEHRPLTSFQLRDFWMETSGVNELKQQGFQKISQGITTPAEIRRVVA